MGCGDETTESRRACVDAKSTVDVSVSISVQILRDLWQLCSGIDVEVIRWRGSVQDSCWSIVVVSDCTWKLSYGKDSEGQDNGSNKE